MVVRSRDLMSVFPWEETEETMKLYTALGIAIGVLIAIWTFLAVGTTSLGLIVWAGIVAWGAFFAAGGGTEGLKKTIASNLSGNFWAFLALLIFAKVGGGSNLILALLVGVIAFMMCVQANVPLLSFIPGAFLGAATWVAAGGGGSLTKASLMISVSMILGAFFGYISEIVGKKLAASPATA
jgi:hypothetical protein